MHLSHTTHFSPDMIAIQITFITQALLNIEHIEKYLQWSWLHTSK